MVTASDILTQVKRRTGQLARHIQRAEVAATDSQDDLLFDLLRQAVSRILVESLRIEGTLSVSLQAGVADYRITEEDLFTVDSVSYDGGIALRRARDSEALRLKANTQEGTPEEYTMYAGYLWLDKKPDSAFVADHASLDVCGRLVEGYPVGDPEDVIPLLPATFEQALVEAVMAGWLELVVDPAVQPLAAKYGASFERFLVQYRGQGRAPQTAPITYRPI